MIRHLVRLLGYSSFALAAEECDEGTFIQGASRLRRQTDALAVGKSSDGTQLLKSVKKIADTVNKLHQRIDDDALRAIGEAIGSTAAVIGESLPRLTAEHEQAQSQIDIARDAALACSSSDVNGQEVVTDLNGDLVADRNSHVTCRETQVQLLEAQTTACDALSNFMTQLPEASCGMPSRDNRESMGDMLHNMNTYVATWHDQFNELRAACESAETAYAQHTCGTSQSQFEATYCAQRTACSVLDDCWNREKAELDDISNSERASMELRHSQFRSLTQAQCILGLVEQAVRSSSMVDNDAVNQCGEGISVDDLILTFHDPQPPTGCAEAQTPATCTSEFLNNEYGEFPAWQRQETDPACIQCQHHATLIMKAVTDLFIYSSPYWENTDTLNPASPVETVEDAKYETFMSSRFNSIRLCPGGPTTQCINHRLQQTYESAHELFTAGFIRDESIDQAAWLTAFEAGNRDNVLCPMQLPGFNTQCRHDNEARFGWCNNQPGQPCQSGDGQDADGAIGIGLRGQVGGRGLNGGSTGAGITDLFSGTARTIPTWIYVEEV